MSEEIKNMGAMNKLSDEETEQVTGAVYAKSDKWWDADSDLGSEYHFDVDNPWIVFDDASCKVLGRYATKDLAKKYAEKKGVKVKEIDRDDLKAGIDAYNCHKQALRGYQWLSGNTPTGDWTNPVFK